VSADVLLGDGTEARIPVDDLGFGYRDSRLKHSAADGSGEVVIAATFRLESAPADTIKERLDDIRRWRQTHQPLGIPSAGSAFRNPAEGPSAGELIDRAGLKGVRIGGASVSEKHANFVINDGRGSAADVRRLMDQVRATILERDGVDLEPEIVFVGDWSGWPWPADDGGGKAEP
jgi:UDP-N-acetylmuramate dehydrogenase